MKWYMKIRNLFPCKKCVELKKNYPHLDTTLFSDISPEELNIELKELVQDQSTKILDLEKEVVFWKEKAMNFKKFHK